MTVVRTCDPTIVHQTGFKTDDVDLRFGILVPDNGTGMPDWARARQAPRLEGPGLWVTQVLSAQGPRQITYRLWLDSVADAQTLEGLVLETGTLTLVRGMHAASGASVTPIFIVDRVYDQIANVTLLDTANEVVYTSGTVEVDAIFQLDG